MTASRLDRTFLFDGPGVISFSGGRTSGMMLWMTIQAYGGTLPADVVVCFANTGKEEEATLEFVRDCGDRWDVPIVWIENRPRNEARGKEFAIVDFATASRRGEPFADLHDEKKFLPNPVARFCTAELKVRPMQRYLKSIGLVEWTTFIGMRADEPVRVARLANQDYGKHEVKEAPLAAAGLTVADVSAFWAAQDFDLGLPNMSGKTMHGNCDLCFLKGGNQVLSLIREKPSRALWWIQQEKNAQTAGSGAGGWFRKDRPSYQAMYDMAMNHGELFPFDDALTDCGCTD
ncbi:phosphoadenosine phosphosulfate reductase family protein [Janthinobacterium sp.]|uniref:phosphoadenosine phosphosulfate reductase family protein n=1 Tax=Janthinobacterium sp. TaxID=1871054 RepID=UPI00260EDDAE|nr:phosphoadenosine phosphosulfate reductase family protein [Janthinobacterium sp.]